MRRIAIVLAAFLLLSMVARAASPPDLSWNVMAGGGGRVANPTLELEGTVGQAVAGTVSGGAVELGVGFWPGAALYYRHLPLVLR